MEVLGDRHPAGVDLAVAAVEHQVGAVFTEGASGRFQMQVSSLAYRRLKKHRQASTRQRKDDPNARSPLSRQLTDAVKAAVGRRPGLAHRAEPRRSDHRIIWAM